MTNDLISRGELLKALPKGTALLRFQVLDAIRSVPSVKVDGNTSDGYHTFDELYHHRAVLFALIVATYPERCWKSKHHHDGSMYDGMFIVGIDTLDGQATYHYDIDPYWDDFACREVDFAPEWDGHTPAQAIERIDMLRWHMQRQQRWKHGRMCDDA